MKKLLIWGAGDQGLVTLDCALAANRYGRIDFLDIREKGRREIPDFQIYGEKDVDLGTFLASYDECIVATGDNRIRESKLAVLASMETSVATVIHPSAVISPFAKVADGCTVLAHAVINANASVGTGCIINTAAVVEHDCVIGDFVNISPKASMAGHTVVGGKCFLGIGCTIMDGIHIGNEVIVGAGAVVIRDIPDNSVVAGVPARSIQARKHQAREQ